MSPLYVRGYGLACPLGLTGPAACAAIRAGITRVRESSYLDNNQEPIRASALELLGDRLAPERALDLLAWAIGGAAGGVPDLAAVPLLILLADAQQVPRWPSQTHLFDALEQRLGRSLDRRQSRISFGGSVQTLEALSEARTRMASGHVDNLIVAAADSFMGASRLLLLEQQGRLLTEQNSDGVIPGEAAASVLLTHRRSGAQASVLGLGFAKEPSTLWNDEPLRADGLSDAARAALAEAGLRFADLDFRVSDASGESFGFTEQALLVSRLLRARKSVLPLWLCAESLGFTGAAGALCGLVTALAGWNRNYAPGPRAIVCAGDANGLRGAAVLQTLHGAGVT
ncbi:MAG TPA: hypothetical protein VEX18_08660 [Polyangiaceae bacterium]|nr:hypothetical protein [Polyangiaceae bacterium]